MSSDNRENKRLHELGEFGLIDRLSAIVGGTLGENVVGIGDDCAVIPVPAIEGKASSTSLVVTTDTMVEGRHFNWDFTSAFDLGWKLLAVNLSDLAAAGASPSAAVITLQLRRNLESVIIEELYRGIATLAKHHGVSLAGGDTVSANEVALGATVFGFSNQTRNRSGAKAGDDLWVSGEIGGGGLGLLLSQQKISTEAFSDSGKAARDKYCRPVPRVELGQELNQISAIRTAIDISDGLLQDAGHIARKSAICLEIDLERVPLVQTSSPKWTTLHACTAGDDYELLFAAPQSEQQAILALQNKLGLKLTKIGKVLPADGREAGSVLIREGEALTPTADRLNAIGLSSLGYDHFG